jgi:hypothetical protein
MTWGVEDKVTERFMAAGVPKDDIAFSRDTFTFNYSGTPQSFVGEFRFYYGPTMNAFAAAEGSGRAEKLQAELEALFASQNTSASLAVTRIPATFLRVTVVRE